DAKVLAARLDEGLAVLAQLLTGEPVTFHGEHVTVEDVRLQPAPAQRVPVWVAGRWPNKAPFRRAARWDGAVPLFPGYADQHPPAAEDVRALATFLHECRAAEGRDGEAFELVVGGRTAGAGDL